MAVEASEYVVKRVDDLENRVRGHPGLRAIETSLTVLALGGTVWLGFKGYDVMSDIAIAADESMRAVEGYISPLEVEVNAASLTDEALGIMRVKWGRESRLNLAVNTHRFKSIRAKLTDGVGSLKTHDIRFMKGVEAYLVKVGYIVAEETTGAMHPLDKATGFVLGSKVFPMIVLGMALIPILPVLGGVVKGAVKDG